MTVTIAMQQGAAGGANAELGQQISEQVQREIQQAVAQANAAQANAAQGAGGAAAAAQAEANVVRITPEGTILRTEDGRELIVQTEEFIPPWIQDGPPDGVFMVPVALFASIAFVIVGLPIARAFARRMDSKHAAMPAVAPSADLRQLQTSVDTMAVEIERISESQRFLTRVLSDGRAAELLPVRDGSNAVPR